jgi:hypothetical protein
VVTKSLALKNIRQDFSSFKEHLQKNLFKKFCSFPSLGKDAKLVVPIPPDFISHLQNKKLNELPNYKNISNFTANSSFEQ